MWSHHKHTHMCVGACALYCCCWSRTGNDELHHRTSNAQTRGARLAAICDNRTDVTTSYFQFSTQQTAWPTNTRDGIITNRSGRGEVCDLGLEYFAAVKVWKTTTDSCQTFSEWKENKAILAKTSSFKTTTNRYNGSHNNRRNL